MGRRATKNLSRKSRPSSKGHETYLHDPGLADGQRYLTGFEKTPLGPNDEQARARSGPFSLKYNFEHDETGLYAGADWRQIDDLVPETGSELALRLDAHTNNTSLVLAFEVGEGGPVFLFPADAQVGNWLSWSTAKWEGKHKGLSSHDLLGRTMFYKVGHHASHNATLSEHGLELMPDDTLTAFIPLDRGTARKQRWKMPHTPLFERLKKKTDGKVMISEDGKMDKKPDNVVVTDLYCDFIYEP